MADKPTFEGQEPAFQGIVDLLEPTFVIKWSTGQLERALELGLDVYVCSLKPSLGAQDAWWRKLVKAENVFLFDELAAGTLAVNEIGRKAYLPWQRLFSALGIPWETRYERLNVARAALVEHGVIDARNPAAFGSAS